MEQCTNLQHVFIEENDTEFGTPCVCETFFLWQDINGNITLELNNEETM